MTQDDLETITVPDLCLECQAHLQSMATQAVHRPETTRFNAAYIAALAEACKALAKLNKFH